MFAVHVGKCVINSPNVISNVFGDEPNERQFIQKHTKHVLKF